MANRDMSQSVRELDIQLREYKTAQKRLSSTVQAFTKTLTVTEPAHGLSYIWANGANPNSFVANIFASSPQVPDDKAPFYDYMPTFDGNGRIGWKICMRFADTGTISVTYTVVCNQEVTLVHE